MYPSKHKEIVTSLMDGKFITIDDKLFDTVKENESFYLNFFDKSFGFELKGSQDFYHLLSHETNENTSRDVSIFFSILCFELDKEGKNFIDELNYSEFYIDDIVTYFKNSSWTDIIKANKNLNTPESIKKLIGTTLVKRNIALKLSEDRYAFTKAYKLFVEFAKDLVKDVSNFS